MSDAETKDLFGNLMKKQTDRTKICLEEIVARLVGHQFRIPEGFADWVNAKIKLFKAPDGNLAAIDVVFDDGGHLEISIARSGWGSPVKDPSKLPPVVSE